jgi:hypothetical protein
MARMKHVVMMGCICLLLSLAGSTYAQDDLFGRINALRTNRGLPAYSINSALTAAAQSQAQWMVDNGCAIAHTRPDGSNPRSRAQAAGYPTSDVSENIYCGGNASRDSAWTFWVNSSIHYAGLVNTRYQEIGLASAEGSGGRSFVLVFGNPGAPAYVPPAAAAGGGGGPAAPAAPPSFVVGVDPVGNIMHEIQPEDTLGQIALIYGYSWGDIPNILALNGMTEGDYRKLAIGSVILIPPYDGTYTPTPGGPPADSATATAVPVNSVANETTLQPTITPTAEAIQPITFTPLPAVATANAIPQTMQVVTASAVPSPLPEGVAFAVTAPGMPLNVDTSAAEPLQAASTNAGPPAWLIVGLVVQVGVIIAAGLEYIRRGKHR